MHSKWRVHQRPANLFLYNLFTKSFAAFAQLLEQKIYHQLVILNYATNIISQPVFALTGRNMFISMENLWRPFKNSLFLLLLKRVIDYSSYNFIKTIPNFELDFFVSLFLSFGVYRYLVKKAILHFLPAALQPSCILYNFYVFKFLYIFSLACVCWPLLCLCRTHMIFEVCLDSKP